MHVTSTTKEGLDKAVEKIEELMKQELGSLVDERRFRRREPVEQLERDEFGRVRRLAYDVKFGTNKRSVNGPKNVFLSASNRYQVSTCVLPLLVIKEHMSSTYNRRLGVESRSREGVLGLWRITLIERVMKKCIYMSRKKSQAW